MGLHFDMLPPGEAKPVKEAGSNESSLWLDHVHSVAIILQAATYGSMVWKMVVVRVPSGKICRTLSHLAGGGEVLLGHLPKTRHDQSSG